MMHLFGPPVPPPRSQWLHVWIEEKRHRQIETLLDEAFATLSDLRAIQRRKPELADIAPELPAFTRELASLIVRVRAPQVRLCRTALYRFDRLPASSYF